MRQNITVSLSPKEQPGVELLQILEVLLPVTFKLVEHGISDDGGAIVFETTRPGSSEGEGAELMRLTLPSATVQGSITLTEAPVTFSDESVVPFPFRGRKLKIKVPAESPPISVATGESVMANSQSGPVWVVSSRQGLRHVRSSFPLPTIEADGMLQQVLNADRFLELLPLLEFLHEACAHLMLPHPPLRACFMFDDPNLHWPRYGFVDYKDIASRAAKENYHVSFATVPLDGWFTHPGAARLFRDHPERLSLLVHGNEHTHYELAQDYAAERRPALLHEAIRRIERLERASGCRVSRVMAAPHGACSEAMLREMTRCGFESAAISHGSLRAHNKGRPWTRRLGYLPSEIVEGCPVLPRWGMTASTLNTILLAAYLGQPIILRGHHADLRNGAELLDELGRTINGLGPVRWASMTELSRMNYQFQVKRETVYLRPAGVNLNVHLPRGAKHLVIEENPVPVWGDWICDGTGPHAVRIFPGKSVEISEGRQKMALTAVVNATPNPVNGARRLPVWPLLRRVLTEGRDRIQAISR